jgi:solute:Na+ symporter, SSS family
VGVLGRSAFPDLPASRSDSIFPLLLGRYTSPVLGTLLLTAGLAALMSTMDSQLLTLASMLTLDFGGRAAPGTGVARHRITAVLIGLAGLAIAARPPQTILDFVNRTSFTGLAVLAPTVVGGLFWKRANRYGVVASIAAGELCVLLWGLGVLRTPRLLPVIPALSAAAAAFVLVSLLTRSSGEEPGLVFPIHARPAWVAIVFLALFVLANDFWAWGRTPIRVAGLPLWVYYHALLGLLLACAFAVLLRAPPFSPGRSPGR